METLAFSDAKMAPYLAEEDVLASVVFCRLVAEMLLTRLQ
jgi:hypothetical protein